MGSLGGGPRDETPPTVVSDKTTANQQTNFSEEEIIITLDEWVKLDDAITRILISPPMSRPPEYKIKGKSVIIRFREGEELRDSATYSINFGEAIVDITEGNPLKDYVFVFSTGDKIDSLSIQGSVNDAFTGEPVEDATVMVYDSLQDSVIYTQKPFYATRTGEDGTFRINNMKGGTFKVVAVQDANLNYSYDPESEAIAFLDQDIVLGNDSVPNLQLVMSTEEADPLMERPDTSPWNQALLTYNRVPYEVSVSYSDSDGSLFIDQVDKTVQIWANSEDRSSWSLFFTDTIRDLVDTVILKRNPPPAKLEALTRKTRLVPSAHPADPFYFCFDRPLGRIDTSFFRAFTADSMPASIPSISILDSLPLCAVLSGPWQADSIYRLTALPGAFNDIYGLTTDTLELTIPIGSNERFGSIALNVMGLDSTTSYLLELLIKEKVQRTEYVTNQTSFSKTFSKLKPGTYQLRIIEDTNGNRRWDTGKYLSKIQPEKIISTDIEPLRANWDVEVQYEWQ